MADKRVIVALDVPTEAAAIQLIDQLAPEAAGFKVGLELVMGNGLLPLSTILYTRASKFMLDGKFHDIPNTVARAVRNAACWRPWALTLHCSGGVEMMAAAAASARQTADPRPLLLGVTVLTSLDYQALIELTFRNGLTMSDAGDAEQLQRGMMAELVVHLATLAQLSGLDGIVASPREAALIRDRCGPEFLIVTPGVRPSGADVQDQKRITTPAQAIAAGADYLVVGRPVTEAADPLAALQAINAEVETALAQRGE